MVVPYVLLAVAIAVEVVSTALLPRTEGFREPFWAVIVLTGYAIAIWLLAIVVQQLPVSVTYAVWAGLGTAVIAVVGVIYLEETWNPVKIGALLLIIVGVIVLNLEGVH